MNINEIRSFVHGLAISPNKGKAKEIIHELSQQDRKVLKCVIKGKKKAQDDDVKRLGERLVELNKATHFSKEPKRFSHGFKNLFWTRIGSSHILKKAKKIELAPLEKKKKIKVKKIEVKLPAEIKLVLDKLFDNSIDRLPVYPVILNKAEYGAPKREVMKAPIMKGMTDDGRAFIAIKLDCILTDEDIAKRCRGSRDHYEEHRQIENLLILHQKYVHGPLPIGEGDGKFPWFQLSGSDHFEPLFFTSNFTYGEDGSGPTEGQKDSFKLLQELLKTGKGEDLHGLSWTIPVK